MVDIIEHRQVSVVVSEHQVSAGLVQCIYVPVEESTCKSTLLFVIVCYRLIQKLSTPPLTKAKPQSAKGRVVLQELSYGAQLVLESSLPPVRCYRLIIFDFTIPTPFFKRYPEPRKTGMQIKFCILESSLRERNTVSFRKPGVLLSKRFRASRKPAWY